MHRYIPGTIPHNIFVIGAGGTGSRLIPLLSQFLRSITRGRTATGWIENPNVWLIDDDVVEAKNILRQNFIEPDVGKHKASVLAERYSRAYGVNIVPILQRVTAENRGGLIQTIRQTVRALTEGDVASSENAILDTAMVIICVDSVQARRDILEVFCHRTQRGDHPAQYMFFIDAGNEDNFGQVSMFNPVLMYENQSTSNLYKNRPESRKVPKLVPTMVDVNYIPMPLAYYRDLEDTPAQGSCADLNQTLAINAIMATTIMGIVQNYYYRKPMTFNSVSISLDGGNLTTHNTFNNWLQRAIPYDIAIQMSKGEYSFTTNGRRQMWTFGKSLRYETVETVADRIINQLDEERMQAERAAAEAREAAEKEARAKARQEAAERRRAEQQAQADSTRVQQEEARREELRQRAAARRAERANIEVSGEAQAEPATEAPAVPELIAVPRVRRTAELAVPEGWTATASDGGGDNVVESNPGRATRRTRALRPDAGAMVAEAVVEVEAEETAEARMARAVNSVPPEARGANFVASESEFIEVSETA